jgi:hypothetical protein
VQFGEKMLQTLVRQNELVAQLCSVMRDIKNVKGGTQKKIEKLRQLLSGLLSELTYFDEVCKQFTFHVILRENSRRPHSFSLFPQMYLLNMLANSLSAM